MKWSINASKREGEGSGELYLLQNSALAKTQSLETEKKET